MADPDQPICAEDECDTPLPDERIELSEAPLDGTGEWVATSEYDEYGHISKWTGECQTINVGICAACEQHQQALIAKLEVMNPSES